MDNGEKSLCTFFLVVIAIIVYFWWSTSSGQTKTIERLKEQVSEYEEKIEQLEKENESMAEVMAYYDLY
jgi:cell division protein FtsB